MYRSSGLFLKCERRHAMLVSSPKLGESKEPPMKRFFSPRPRSAVVTGGLEC